MSLLLTFGKKSVIQRALSVLRKFGTDAHAYIPGGSISTDGPELAVAPTSYGSSSVSSDETGVTVTATTNGTYGVSLSGIVSNTKTYLYSVTLLTNSASKILYIFPSASSGATATGASLGDRQCTAMPTGASAGALFAITGGVTGESFKITNISVKEVLTTTSVVLNGLTAGNYTDTAGTQAAIKDAPIGKATDAIDGIHATQGTAGNKPVLRQGPVNLLLNSATLSTQSVAVAASPYTLSFTGTGTVTKSGTATGALVGTGATDRVTQTFTPTAGTLTLTVTGSVTSAQLQLGLAATTYIPTTSAKASAGTGPSYWEFGGDGTPTDYLSLGSVPFQSSDDHCVIVGASVKSIAAGSKPLFSNYGTTTRRVAQLSVDADTLTAKWTDDAGTAGTSPTGSVVAALTPFVATARKVGNVKELWKNSVLINSSSTAMGTTTLTASAIGYDGASYCNGSQHVVFSIKGTVSDADRLLIEKLAANLAGVTL